LSSIQGHHIPIKSDDSEQINLKSELVDEADNSQEPADDTNSYSDRCDINSKSPEVDVYKSQTTTENDFQEVDDGSNDIHSSDFESTQKSTKVPTPELLDETDNTSSLPCGNVQYGADSTDIHDNTTCDIKQSQNYLQDIADDRDSPKEAERKSPTCDVMNGGSVFNNSDLSQSTSEDSSIYSKSFSVTENSSSASQMQDMVDNLISQSNATLQPHMFEEEPEELSISDDINKLHPGEVMYVVSIIPIIIKKFMSPDILYFIYTCQTLIWHRLSV
jgi:hypothetical protein